MSISHGKSIYRRASASGPGYETNVSVRRRLIATCVTLICLGAALIAPAADISVMVLDRDGHGVSEVVVTAAPTAAATGPSTKTAVMDQRDLAFAPRVLAVAVGTSVEFPNNDSVSHQVYSFSPAKRFQLPLYKGQPHAPITFDQVGLVVLGCNIHDSMVGYIYVTDAPYFGTTDMSGSLHLNQLPADEYRITLWSPLIADAPATLIRSLRVDGNESAMLRVQLTLPLRKRPEPRPRRRDWEY